MSSTRETLKHASIYSAAGILSKLAGFIMLPFYAHALGAEGYGIIGMVDASITMLTSLLAYGGQSAITRLYHELPEGRKAAAVSTAYWLISAITAALVAISMAASAPISELLLGDASLNLILCIALISFFLDMSGQTAGSILLIKRQSFLFSMISLLRLISGLSLNIVFIVIMEWGVFGYFLSSALTSLASFIVFQHICLRDCGRKYDQRIAREIILFQLPLIPSALISFASRQSERVILRFVESIEKVGVLEMGYKFPSLLQLLIATPLMNSWDTERTRIAQEGKDNAAQKIGDMFTLSLYLLTLGGLLIALCIGDVLAILTPESFWEAKRIAQIECVTVILSSVTYHCNFGYLYQKDSTGWAKLTAGTSIAKIGLSFAFITWLGILGAAYSALCVSTLLLVMAFIGGQRRYAIKYRGDTNLLICCAALALFAIAELEAVALMNVARAAAATTIAWLHSDYESLGKLIDINATSIVHEKLPLVIDVALRLLIGSVFLVLLPYAHPALKLWLYSKIRR